MSPGAVFWHACAEGKTHERTEVPGIAEHFQCFLCYSPMLAALLQANLALLPSSLE